jgi:putative transposase
VGTSALHKNAVVHLEGSEYLLLRKISDSCWQLEDTKTKRIVERELTQLLREYATGKLTFVSQHGRLCGKAVASISPEARVRRLYVLAALKATTRAALDQAINDVWTKTNSPVTPPSYVTVYRWKARYITSGNDVRSLMDDSSKRGNRTDRFPSEVVEICEQSIATVFMTRERNTLQDALEDAMLKVTRVNETRPKDMALPVPTRRLMRRLIAHIPAFDKHSARYGHQEAVKHFRSVKGQHVSREPLERAEIDHTHLDLFVVDDERSLPLGRPWVTACLDAYTRCILGIHVSFTPPSYLTVAKCLKDAFLPKTWLKDEYPEIRCEWPAYGVMRELLLDNGAEFHSESLEQVCFSLGIEMHYSPRKEPWFKGKIERFFRTYNKGVAHGTPGTCFSNIFDRGDYDPAKHAIVTLSTLKKISRLWVADIYHQKPHRALGISPAHLWNSVVLPEDISLPDDPNQLDVIMGRVDRRVLSHKGIERDGLLYNSPDLHQLRCKHGSRLEVEIRVDESDLGYIYVLAPQTAEAFKVPALRFDYANGISQWQHQIFLKYHARHSDVNKGADGWLQARETISRLIEKDLDLKRHRSRKRIGRYLEDCEPANHGTVAHSPIVLAPQVHAPEPSAVAALPASTDDSEIRDTADANEVEDLPVTIEERTIRA